jgi:hypothetical protein
MAATFLGSPAEIRRAINSIATGATTFDVAVAFVGGEWHELLGGYEGRLRVICWLSNPATDPRAVSQLKLRPQTRVRQRDGMHAKVYIAPGMGAVVASANLSHAALDALGLEVRDEAGIAVSPSAALRAIERWFRALWKDDGSRRITPADIEEAMRRFFATRRPPPRLRPPAGRLHTTLHALAKRVRHLDLNSHIGEHRLFRGVEPGQITRGQVRSLVNHLVGWAGRSWIYRDLLTAPLPRIRHGLDLLFDEGQDVRVRLSELLDRAFLGRLGIASLSILLYWRRPERYPPFNVRTEIFLDHFRLARRGVSAATPATYERWLAYADELAREYRLQTPGHVDRMVWEYTQDVEIG